MLIDRGTGEARSVVIERIDADSIMPVVLKNVDRESTIMTDEANVYRPVRRYFAAHGVVNHGQDVYVDRENDAIHSNTVEGYFSIFKRGMKGIYQHCGEQHLHRYLAEFDFRYSYRMALGYNDADRADALLSGIIGKRLTYA